MAAKLTLQQKAERARTAARKRGIQARKATNALDKSIITGRPMKSKNKNPEKYVR